MLIFGCDKAKRHKVLTFFFDGVPPLELAYLDPNSPDYLERVAEIQKKTRASRHESGRTCSGGCHTDGILIKPVPVLCYDCHDDYSKQTIHVHGPVVVGDCLFCHDPHASPNLHLLKKPIPDMCFICHDQVAVRLIEGHDDERYADCTSCHSGHGSNTRGLLKSDAIVIPKDSLNEKDKALWDGLINLVRPGRKSESNDELRITNDE